MGKNLSYQFKNAVDQAFSGGGTDKHSAKQQHTGNNMETVYSFAERKNLINTSHQIGDFIKDNYSGIKFVRDIKPSMIQDFLNSKANSCDKMTLGQYASRINKLEAVVNKLYKANVNWKNDLVVPVSIKGNEVRDIAMSREDYTLILSKDSISKAKIAIELSGRFGLRVSETCKMRPMDINFNTMQLHIHESKGGRSRDLPILPGDVSFLKNIIEGKSVTDRIVNIKEDSVNKYLARTEKELGIRKEYKEADTGIHCIRKMVAQERYDSYRAENMTRKGALNTVSHYLGHGDNRFATMEHYVLNIH